jgi:hypothetical protein
MSGKAPLFRQIENKPGGYAARDGGIARRQPEKRRDVLKE